MANHNNSAVLDVVVESKEITTLLKDAIDFEHSIIKSDTNSLVQSPSIESFSTLNDIEILSELNMDEDSDFCVKIDCPEKNLDTLETYITFRITTRVARIEFTENEYVVRRRYNDFLWLRQKLVECHPFCVVPPLPAKHTLIGQLDRYSKDFILLRMKALNVFITRITQHPILACSESVKVFLTAKPNDFAKLRKLKIPPVENAIRTLAYSNSTHSALKTRHLEFDKTKIYLTILSEKMTSIEKISHRINKESTELITELNSFHPIFTTWAMSEPALCGTLENIGRALERSNAALSALVHGYSNSMAYPISEFLNYIEVVQGTLKRRESYQAAYESSVDELNRKHNEKNKLLAQSQNVSTPSSTSFSLWKPQNPDNRLEKLGTSIPNLLKKVECDQDNLECANESLRSDLERWHIDKKQCIKKILLDFVNKQINYYETSVNAWEHVNNELFKDCGSKDPKQ